MQEEKDSFIKGYNQWSDDLLRYALFKVSNRELALDIVQDTFTKTWEYIYDGKKIDNLRAFLYKTLKNLIIDSYRKKTSESLDNLLEEGFDYGYDEREKIESNLSGQELWEHVDNLDVKYQEVIVLRYMNDLSIAEISEISGETENNISVRIHRGLEKLKQISKLEEQK